MQDEGKSGERDITTWRDGSPDATARQRAVLSQAGEMITTALGDAFVKAERVGAVARLVAWVGSDAVWRAEPFGAGGAGLDDWMALCGLAGAHGFGKHVGQLRRVVGDAEEAAERLRKAARIAEANGGREGGGQDTGRRPVPAWALPPALREAAGRLSDGRVLPPMRHGLADGIEWWGVGQDGVLRAFKEVVKKMDGEEYTEVKPRVVASHPIWIVERGTDVEHGHDVVTLAWRAESGPGHPNGPWRQKTVGRAVIADPRKLVELAADGAPVTAGDVARGLVDWLADLVADRTCRSVIGESAAVTPRLGWVGHDPSAPAGWVGPAGWTEAAPSAPAVRLMAPDGLEAVAAAMRPAGKVDALAEVLARGTATLWCAVGAALASPLLRPLGLQGWILDVAGSTSGGKTSALQVAAAVWGDPERLIRTWRDTDVFLFSTAAFLGNVPVFIDDTKTEGDPKRIARVVYSLTSGTERGRGSADGGVRTLRTWRSVGILTGEQPLTSFSSDAGTRARVLPLWGQVFRSADEAEAAVSAARRSWGHLGAGFVAALCAPGQIERVRGLCDEWGEWLRGELGGAGADGVALRLRLPAASVLAALAFAAESGLITITGAQWDEVRGALLKSIRAGAADADQPLAALLAAESERMAHPDRWIGHEAAAGATDTPTAGWAGIFDHERGVVYWLPGALEGALLRAGHRPAEVLARWADRGWRLTEKDGKDPRKTLCGNRGRFVAVKVGVALPEHARTGEAPAAPTGKRAAPSAGPAQTGGLFDPTFDDPGSLGDHDN